MYVFETVSTAVAVNIDGIRGLNDEQLRERIIEFKKHPNFVNNTGAGANIKSRLHGRVSLAHSFFAC